MDDMAAYYTLYQPPPTPGTAQPPPVAVAPPPYAAFIPQSPHYQVRTLFVAGLPEDVKPREIYNLFREFPGYESSHLRTPTANTQPFAFAVFVDQHSALVALHALNAISSNKAIVNVSIDKQPLTTGEGMVFDLEKGSTLYIDLAKSNPRSKRLRTDDEKSVLQKRYKVSDAFSMGDVSGVGSVHMSGMSSSAYNTIGYSSTQSHGNFESRAVGNATGKSNAPPCPTLFVANLAPTCSEQELIQVFSRCRGFLKLKMQSTYGTPVAFIDFQDTSCSTEALNHLQGTALYSSPSAEGMRLEYAKSRMGMRSKRAR